MRGLVHRWDGEPDDGTWIEPTLFGSWDTYPGEEPLGYRRIDGIVYLKGVVRRTATGGLNEAWYFLPAGYRPVSTGSNGWVQQSVWTNAGAQVLYIRDDGALYLPGVNVGLGGYVLMGDVTPFPADA